MNLIYNLILNYHQHKLRKLETKLTKVEEEIKITDKFIKGLYGFQLNRKYGDIYTESGDRRCNLAKDWLYLQIKRNTLINKLNLTNKNAN